MVRKHYNIKKSIFVYNMFMFWKNLFKIVRSVLSLDAGGDPYMDGKLRIVREAEVLYEGGVKICLGS